MGFVQIIEFETDNIDGVRAVGQEWEAAGNGAQFRNLDTLEIVDL